MPTASETTGHDFPPGFEITVPGGKVNAAASGWQKILSLAPVVN
jgi:hypothetical protein